MPNTPDTQKEEIFAIQNIFGKPPVIPVYAEPGKPIVYSCQADPLLVFYGLTKY